MISGLHLISATSTNATFFCLQKVVLEGYVVIKTHTIKLKMYFVSIALTFYSYLLKIMFRLNISYICRCYLQVKHVSFWAHFSVFALLLYFVTCCMLKLVN